MVFLFGNYLPFTSFLAGNICLMMDSAEEGSEEMDKRLIEALEKIGKELEKCNDLRQTRIVNAYVRSEIEYIASEIGEVEPTLGRLLREYIK